MLIYKNNFLNADMLVAFNYLDVNFYFWIINIMNYLRKITKRVFLLPRQEPFL
jgi:hypothetical protein